LIRPHPDKLRRLRHLHKATCELAASTPDILTAPAVARAFEEQLYRAVVECLANDDLAPHGIRVRDRAAVMRQFERALDAHEGEPIYLTGLCAEIGVSDRLLRQHCQDHLGMSPQHYLWLRRMDLARRALALADPDKTTVTTVATDHGFGELGRFAVQYRKLFGECPSATLRGGRVAFAI
jgi:AraC-like DNA-binding protein